MAIFTQYGDHLYAKGDHDGAIQQYIRTIGKLEASYVIRKVRVWVLSLCAVEFLKELLSLCLFLSLCHTLSLPHSPFYSLSLFLSVSVSVSLSLSLSKVGILFLPVL